jgi:hypothetical protein
MATYVIRGVDPDLIGAAKTKARARGERLDAVLIETIRAYAEGQTAAAQLAAAGGRARADKMTRTERSESARRAVEARWAKAAARSKDD